ncbi:hypothetical protein BT69DRAFT_1117858 [Atractiella rhizophila]|nr:hypothetical protein BT69DRAFT_1117858 [Atractiella rhizophila]
MYQQASLYQPQQQSFVQQQPHTVPILSTQAGYFQAPQHQQQNPAQQFAHGRSMSVSATPQMQMPPGQMLQAGGMGMMQPMAPQNRSSSVSSIQPTNGSFSSVANATIQPMSPQFMGHNRRSTVAQIPSFPLGQGQQQLQQQAQSNATPSQVNYNHLLPVVAKPQGQQGQAQNEWSVKPPTNQQSSFADLLDMASVKPGAPMTSSQPTPPLSAMAPTPGYGANGMGMGSMNNGMGIGMMNNGMGMGVGAGAGMTLQAMSKQGLWNSQQPQNQAPQQQGQGQQSFFF